MADPHNGHGRVLLPNVPGFLVTILSGFVHARGHCICRRPSAINQDFSVTASSNFFLAGTPRALQLEEPQSRDPGAPVLFQRGSIRDD